MPGPAVVKGTTAGADLDVDDLRFDRLARGGTLRGRVVAAGEGVIAGARVATGNVQAITAADGTFTLSGISHGEQKIHFRAGGYKEAEETVTIPAGGTLELDDDVLLAPLPGITGRVLDPAGAAATSRSSQATVAS